MISSSEAFLSGDWRKSKLFIRYPNGLRIWVNGNASESWQVEHEGATSTTCRRSAGSPSAPTASMSVRESLDGKRYDRVSSPECVFLDGRGTWRDFDGIGTSGSVAVRRAKEGSGLSIITVEAVDKLAIGRPAGTFGPDDVRTAIGAVAQAESIVARACDQDEKDLGEVTIRRTSSGWEVQPPKSTVRLDIAVK